MKSTGAMVPSVNAFMVTIRVLENGNAMLESKLVVYVMVPAWTTAAAPKAQASKTGREGMAYRSILKRRLSVPVLWCGLGCDIVSNRSKRRSYCKYRGSYEKPPMRKLLTLSIAIVSIPTWAAMPASKQNALVKNYCAVCHTDAAKNGGLSLEHYDAAERDPGLAAMILSKLNSGAMGAAGIGVPDKAAQQAWLDSTKEQAAGAKEWFVARKDAHVSASIVREVPPRTSRSGDAPVYRLLITCDASSGNGEMQLTWSPEPQTGRTLTASVDGRTTVEYRLEGRESMGNGASVQSGLASVVSEMECAKGLHWRNSRSLSATSFRVRLSSSALRTSRRRFVPS